MTVTILRRQFITDAAGNPVGVILPLEEFALLSLWNQPLSKYATLSMWYVCGNMSTGCTSINR